LTHNIVYNPKKCQLSEPDTIVSLNQAVKRNIERFPDDFMFQLTKDEYKSLISQNVISKPEGRGGLRNPPLAFTEQGVAMLSSVLTSSRAAEVNIAIMRAFVRLREILVSNRNIERQLKSLDKKVASHDQQLKIIFDTIARLMAPDDKSKKRPLGFRNDT
jgi:hypothetical protein